MRSYREKLQICLSMLFFNLQLVQFWEIMNIISIGVYERKSLLSSGGLCLQNDCVMNAMPATRNNANFIVSGSCMFVDDELFSP